MGLSDFGKPENGNSTGETCYTFAAVNQESTMDNDQIVIANPL